jgi:hypothetical protein
METLKPGLTKQAAYERAWASFCRLACFEVKKLLADRVVKGGDLTSTFIPYQGFPTELCQTLPERRKFLCRALAGSPYAGRMTSAERALAASRSGSEAEGFFPEAD